MFGRVTITLGIGPHSSLNVFRVISGKTHQHLSEKTQFSGFLLFPQVVQEHWLGEVRI